MTQLASQKSQLAKLMATENITVEHNPTAKTASFDVKSRVLTLPVFEDEMSPALYDLMTSHEVGHALWTPLEEWKSAVDKRGRSFQSYLNIIEDARIEKLIKRKFPGLLGAYRTGYKELLNRNFFGTAGADINSYNFIDKINLHFKTGTLLPMISFDEEQSVWVKKISEIETFAEAEELAAKLFAEELEKAEEQAEQEAATAAEHFSVWDDEDDWDDFSSSNDSSDDYDDSEDEDEQDPNISGVPNSSNDDESDETDNPSNSQNQQDFDEEFDEEFDEDDDSSFEPSAGRTAGEIMESSTDGAYSKAMESLSVQSDCEYSYYKIPKTIKKEFKTSVLDYKTFFKIIEDSNMPLHSGYGNEKLTEWTNSNKKVINTMIKEFELKKRAGEFKRAMVAKTGELDMQKVFSYKFNEDLFKRTTLVPTGKNHGFVMLLDWSGSMSENLIPTIDQLMNFVMFCKKVKIPADVYIFTNEISRTGYDGIERNEWGKPLNGPNSDAFNHGDLVPDTSASLLQLFSGDMSHSEFKKSCLYLTLLREGYKRYMYRHWELDYQVYEIYQEIPRALRLSGTPLDSCLLLMPEVINEFKQKYNVEICNFVVLTDGASSTCSYVAKYEEGGEVLGSRFYSYLPYVRNSASGRRVYITDDVTKKSRRVEGDYTKTILETVKDRTNSNVIGMYLINDKPRDIQKTASYFGIYDSNIVKSTREKNFFEVTTAGFDSYFVIPAGKSLMTGDNDSGLDVDSDASKRKIATAFKKNSLKKTNSRVLIGRVIELVA